MKHKIILVCSLLILTFSSFAQTSPFTFERNGQAIDLKSVMQETKVHGISVAIFRNLAVDTLIQWGTRDADKKLAVDSKTLFNAGSMTNALTKFAVVRLAITGAIDLDQPVNKYLTSWQIPEKGFTKNNPITVKDLVLQTRGFIPKAKPTGYIPGAPIPTLLQMLKGEKPSQEKAAIPKSSKNRSGNLSFHPSLILQQLLEDIHKKSFAEIIEKEIFQPLNMKDSYIAAELSVLQKQNASVGYTKEGKLIEGERWIHPELASTGLWTTPADYAKLVIHVQKAARGLDNQLLPVAMAKAGLTPENKKDYRALIFLCNQFGNPHWGGASMGFRTQFIAAKDGSWAVVAFMNSHEQWQFMAEFMGKAIDFAKNRNKQTLGKKTVQ